MDLEHKLTVAKDELEKAALDKVNVSKCLFKWYIIILAGYDVLYHANHAMRYFSTAMCKLAIW